MRAYRAARNLKNGYKNKYWKRKAKSRLKKSVKKLNEIAYQHHLSIRKHDWWKLVDPSTYYSVHRIQVQNRTLVSRALSFLKHLFS